MLCLSVGHAEVTPLYVIPYYIVYSPKGSLKYLFENPVLSGRLVRWHLLLAKFDIVYVTHYEGQQTANHLVENSIDGHQPMTDLFPSESI